MAPQMVSVLRAQRDLILIIPKMLIEQPTKKKYIKQMTKWLTCQEKCHQIGAYLTWAYPQENAGGPDGEEKDLLDDVPEQNESTSFTPGYLVSRYPAYPHIPTSRKKPQACFA